MTWFPDDPARFLGWLLDHTGPDPGELARLIALHVTASFLLSGLFVVLLPTHQRQPLIGCWLFFFGVSLFVPILGPLALALGLAVARYLPQQEPPAKRSQIGIPDLPVQPPQVSSRPAYSHGGVLAALRHASDPRPRVQAVRAASELPDRQGVPVLRLALRDTMDDVRLFAYTALDRKEARINDELSRLFAELETTNQPAAVHARLAGQHWDLTYLGLAEGELGRHALKQARHHAEQAISDPDQAPGMWLLLGRISLQEHNLEAAERAFQRAAEAGVDRSEVAPFMAEIAYQRRDFGRVRSELGQVPRIQRADSALGEILEYWQ